MEEYDLLNDRQKKQAEDLAGLAVEFGMFDQSTGANGAHYAEQNPFVAEGIACSNCVFYDEMNSQCQIVSGSIAPNAVCKLWIIPETLLVASRDAALSRLALKRKKIEYI